MKIKYTAFSISLCLMTLSSCSKVEINSIQAPPSIKNQAHHNGKVKVTLRLPEETFKTQGAVKTVANVASYELKLMAGPSFSTAVQTLIVTSTTAEFTNVADGTYKVQAKALDGTNQNITEGLTVLSSNSVTVAGNSTTYSSGTALMITLQLQNGTGGDISVQIAPGSPPGAVANYNVSLFGLNNSMVSVGSFNSVDGTFKFKNVFDGTYKVQVSAQDATGKMLGVVNPSNNTATVTGGGTVSYSSGSKLDVNMVYDYQLSTIAGNGNYDDAVPLNVAINVPSALALDSNGNLYVADEGHDKVEKINANLALISTISGRSGIPGNASDGAMALGSPLSNPSGIAIDSAGNRYIADRSNHRIKRIDTAGVMTTIIGNGSPGSTGDNGPCSAATIFDVHGMHVANLSGAEFLIFADTNNNKIRACQLTGTFNFVYGVSTSNSNLSTLAGLGVGGSTGDGGQGFAAQLNQPRDVTVNSAGDMFIADTANGKIRKVQNNSAATITTVAGSGVGGFGTDGVPATVEGLNSPTGVAVDSAGHIFIAVENDRRLRMVANAGGTFYNQAMTPGAIYTLHGDGTTTVLNNPKDVVVNSSGTVFVTNTTNRKLDKIETDGTVTTFAGNGETSFGGDGETANEADMDNTNYIAFDKNGNLYISDTSNHRIRKVDATNNIITTVAGTGIAGNSGDGGQATAAQLSTPSGLYIDSMGSIFIVDNGNDQIRKVTSDGMISTFAGTGVSGNGPSGVQATASQLAGPLGISGDSAGNIYIADTANNHVRKVATNGILTTFAGTGLAGSTGDGNQATNAQIAPPLDVAVDAAGNVYMACGGGLFDIRKVDTAGVISTYAGGNVIGFAGDNGPATAAQIGIVSGLALDLVGNLYLVDQVIANRIRRVDSSGIITTIAGDGGTGFVGDGGFATAGQFSTPSGVAVDANGNVYIGDSANDRIRKLTPQ